MRIAIIDLGTNTFNLLIRETETNAVIFNTKISVKLGEGGIDNQVIAPAAFERGLLALAEHCDSIKNYQVDKTYAFATSAIRSTSNGSQFVEEARKKTGIIINVIDGQQEAELIYFGVRQALDMGKDISLIMDIGGGSTEFILANKNEIFWKESYLIGSSRLMEKFRPDDPIPLHQIEAVENYLEASLQSLFETAEQYKPLWLIGSSGSFDTLASMASLKFRGFDLPADHTSYTFDLNQYIAIARQMLQADFEERLNTPGMIPMRADMINMACIQINLVLKKSGLKVMKLSTYALKEGVYSQITQNQSTWQESLL